MINITCNIKRYLYDDTNINNPTKVFIFLFTIYQQQLITFQ